VADGCGPKGWVGAGDGDGAQVSREFGRVGCGGVSLFQGAGQAQMQFHARLGGEPGRQHFAEQVMKEPEPGPAADEDPSDLSLVQMSLDIDAKDVLQEAGAQDGRIEGSRGQCAHAVLREPGQPPLDDVTDRVGTWSGQRRRFRHIPDGGQAGQLSDKQRIARGAVPHPPALGFGRLPAQEPGHQLTNIGWSQPAERDEVGGSGQMP
jgi:hypothetical protein